ncbi:MAG: iron-containing alcohol dehydrogenase [Candidatus Pacebacteria bacterium]|nr:iron-containing alcohol dehydrogenase [Candidatus Paceibacterota bacterium]
MEWETDYSLSYPRHIYFGWDSRQRLNDILAGAVNGLRSPRVFMVSTRSFHKDGGLDELDELLGGCIVGHTAGIPHDPSLAAVDGLVDAIRRVEADTVVAVGGGSVMDAAKAAAAIAPIAGASIVPYYNGERDIVTPGLPFIALPTTAGTGAEITSNSVLTDPATLRKQSLRSPQMIACAAVVDPALTVTMPPRLTAESGLDALAQAIESYVSRRANAVSAALACEAVHLLLTYLPAAYADGTSCEARLKTAEGSLASAMAFSQSGLGAVHGLAHPIGVLLGLPHGLTCAILLPHVMQWNMASSRERFTTLAHTVNVGDAADLVERVQEVCDELQVPDDFRQAGLREDHIPHIVANCRSNSMRSNPRPMSDDEVAEFVKKLLA